MQPGPVGLTDLAPTFRQSTVTERVEAPARRIRRRCRRLFCYSPEFLDLGDALLRASFWRGLHLPVYGIWGYFDLAWRFGASKPEIFSGPQAHVTGAGEPDLSLRESQAKVRHLMSNENLTP